MKLIIIFGPLAVGKMTVAQELENVLGYKLLHNHLTMELLRPFFDIKSAGFNRLDRLFKAEILKELLGSDSEGVIFTSAFDFNEQVSVDFMNEMADYYSAAGATVYYVELEANIEERLKRNEGENRLKHKPSKRELGKAEERLREFEKTHRLNTKEGEFQRANYMRIDNTNLSAKEAATRIRSEFDL